MTLDENLKGVRISLLAQKDIRRILVIGHPVDSSNHGLIISGNFVLPISRYTHHLVKRKLPGRSCGVR